MTLLGWNSFQYDSDGWVLSGPVRTAGTGQSGYASLRETAATYQSGSYSFTAQPEIVMGYCYQFTTIASDRMLDFYLTNVSLCRINILNTGAIQLLGSGGSPVWATSVAGVLNANVEAYIEVRVKPRSDSTGQVEVRVNGNPTPVINATGLDFVGDTVDEVGLGFGGAHGTRDASAFYLLNTSGSAPHNTFLGHIRFGSVLPSGNGNSSQLVGSDGNSTDNYLLVDDGFNHDTDSTYVQSPTAGEKDTYVMGNLPTPALTIFAVCPLLIAKKTDAGTRAVAPVIRSGGTDYTGTDAYLGLDYDSYRSAVIQDPNTAAAWTESGFNAMELGPKVTV